jgi:4-aminobutyrate aminotransferase-like enzyme
MVVDHAYHGNTDRLVQISPYKFDGPGGQGRPEWVHVLPTPDPYRARGAARAEQAGRKVGAFLSEGIMACAGQVVPAPGFLADTFTRVRKAGGVCISDEVQVGFGRVGDHFWGFQLHDVVPDIVTLGKPIGNGHPLAAVVTTREIAEAFDNGMEYFNTFGGNPVSCAVGMAVLDEIADRGLQQRACELGGRFVEDLLNLDHPAIGEVRGHGLFLGVDLVTDRASRQPDGSRASRVVECMKRDGILMSTEGPGHNVLKIKPPLVIGAEDLARVVTSLEKALKETRNHA